MGRGFIKMTVNLTGAVRKLTVWFSNSNAKDKVRTEMQKHHEAPLATKWVSVVTFKILGFKPELEDTQR